MKKLGYLIADSKIRNIADFIEVTDDFSKFDGDNPAIIVGLENARKTIDNFSIIKKEPKPNKFWTFGKTEKRTDYEKDINKFYSYVLGQSVSRIRYYYVDIITLPRQKVKKLLKILSSNDDKYIYIYKGMLYLYYRDYILGISLSLLQYCQINVEKHIKKIALNNKTKISYNDASISPFMKSFAKNKRYLMPYFLSLQT